MNLKKMFIGSKTIHEFKKLCNLFDKKLFNANYFKIFTCNMKVASRKTHFVEDQNPNSKLAAHETTLLSERSFHFLRKFLRIKIHVYEGYIEFICAD